ncbi:hypothetical protein IQ243_09575 [Nostocales cyanobacterium LEGE 11386]|nr:hypothetical protein [Nostocales cyanobacterium LEGE 11386]MBW4556400.1 hypothetical protein [Trichormus sp. ATA11-4-KO1]
MNKTKQQTSKVVPFTGEFYPTEIQPTPAANNTAAYLVMVAASLVAGLSIGAMATYQSADQIELRQMQADVQQLQKVKTQVCR